jgi:tRNA(Ile)-lysidine synthase
MTDPAAAVADAEFSHLMTPFAPFERAPRLAVAVSGGADSLALALLANDWARARRGGVTALTVDHGLRPEAAEEAAQVGSWMARHGIAHVTLTRTGPVPEGDVQAAARRARYRLLEAWCAAAGVLHLLTAHHREDQAETLLLRLARGSGLDGLAGMAAVVERQDCRVLRPFLGTARARLAATLAARGQAWLEDPSNDNPAFARTRLRRAAPWLAAEGLTSTRLATTAAHLARARAALEIAVAQHLARCAWLHPAGFAWLDGARLAAGPREIGLRALGAVIATVGGAPYPPRFAALERLYGMLAVPGASGRTLGGCRILPRRGGRVLVCREAAAAAASCAVAPGMAAWWDGRFRLRLPETAATGLVLGGLGEAGAAAGGAAPDIPAAARPGLPAWRDRLGLLAAPHLGQLRAGSADLLGGDTVPEFCPPRPLTPAGFRVV